MVPPPPLILPPRLWWPPAHRCPRLDVFNVVADVIRVAAAAAPVVIFIFILGRSVIATRRRQSKRPWLEWPRGLPRAGASRPGRPTTEARRQSRRWGCCSPCRFECGRTAASPAAGSASWCLDGASVGFRIPGASSGTWTRFQSPAARNRRPKNLFV